MTDAEFREALREAWRQGWCARAWGWPVDRNPHSPKDPAG